MPHTCQSVSTKIYGGLRLRPGVDVFDMNTRLREHLDPVRDRLDADAVVRATVTLIDDVDTAGTARPRTPIMEAALEPGNDGPDDDPHRFSLSVGRDPVTGIVVAIPFYDVDDYLVALTGSDLFDEYAFWNNADEPDHVTWDEWAEREAVWNRVLPPPGIPARSMLSFDLRTPGKGDVILLTIRDEDGTPRQPVRDAFSRVTVPWRASRLARDWCLHALQEAGGKAGITDDESRALFGAVIDAAAAMVAPLTVEDLYTGGVHVPVDAATFHDAVAEWVTSRL